MEVSSFDFTSLPYKHSSTPTWVALVYQSAQIVSTSVHTHTLHVVNMRSKTPVFKFIPWCLPMKFKPTSHQPASQRSLQVPAKFVCFANELPGTWCTDDECVCVCVYVFWMQKEKKENVCLCIFHKLQQHPSHEQTSKQTTQLYEKNKSFARSFGKENNASDSELKAIVFQGGSSWERMLQPSVVVKRASESNS